MTTRRKQNGHRNGGGVFLTAPKDLHGSEAYERALAGLWECHGKREVVADRALFGPKESYKRTWKDKYAPARLLYVLARDDGTVGLGVFVQWEWLSKRGVPCVALPQGGGLEGEAHEIVLEPIGEKPGEDAVRFARLVPLAVAAPAGSYATARGRGAP